MTQAIRDVLPSLLPDIRKLASQFAFLEEDPDDIVQTVAVNLLAHKSVPVRIHTGYLRSVVHNVAADLHRQLKQERCYVDRTINLDCTGTVCEVDDETSFQLPVHSDNPAEPDLLPAITRVFSMLTNPFKEVLLLHLQGDSYAQIAQMTGTNLGTVSSRIHYARRRVRLLLADYR